MMPGMRRAHLMHWFWRAAIAVGVASAYVVSLYLPPLAGLPPWSWLGRASLYLMGVAGRLCGYGLGFSGAAPWQYNTVVALINYLPAILVALIAYGVVTRFVDRNRAHRGETRCRRCGYILRGLTEPRCPECGEGI